MYKSYNKILLKRTIKNKHTNKLHILPQNAKKLTFKKWVKIKIK